MSFLTRFFGTEESKHADLENIVAQFNQKQGKYLKLLIDGLSDSDVRERRATARVIADTVVPAVVDNCPYQPVAKACLLETLNVLMAELRPPRNEDERWLLNQAAYYTVMSLLRRIERDKAQ